jgi:hypothetical protein
MKREIPELTLGPLRAFARRERRRYEELLKEFVEMPTVSADPAHRADIERAAEVASRASPGLQASGRKPRHPRKLWARPKASHGDPLQSP